MAFAGPLTANARRAGLRRTEAKNCDHVWPSGVACKGSGGHVQGLQRGPGGSPLNSILMLPEVSTGLIPEDDQRRTGGSTAAPPVSMQRTRN